MVLNREPQCGRKEKNGVGEKATETELGDSDRLKFRKFVENQICVKIQKLVINHV